MKRRSLSNYTAKHRDYWDKMINIRMAIKTGSPSVTDFPILDVGEKRDSLGQQFGNSLSVCPHMPQLQKETERELQIEHRCASKSRSAFKESS